MSIRDQLLRKQLQKTSPAHSATDIHETPTPYKRWVPGIRSLLRLRYLKAKESVLVENKQALRYDITASELQNQVQNKLASTRGPWPLILKPVIVLPLLFTLLAAAGYGLWQTHAASLERAVFKNDIPTYSDTVYLLKASKAAADTQTNPEVVTRIEQNIATQTAEVATLKDTINEHFTDSPEVVSKLTALLDAIQEKEIPPQDLYQLVKQVNDELFINRVPYYLSPMVETADCAHLPLSAFMTRMFGGNVQGSGETCVIYALLSFHVDEFRYYNNDNEDHLAFFTRRLDGLPLNENVLGKVHLGDDSAQILLSNIDATSASSTVALNGGQIQTKLMPQGMPDVYGLESIARRIQSRVVDQYADELKQSWKWKFERVWNQLTGAESSLLPHATAKLQRRVADATAFHEVQHLIDQFNDLQEPPWFNDMLIKVAGNTPITPQLSNHVLWELSAFFTHLAYGEELKGILLNEFAAITLNPLLRDQPHYYSIRMLFPILHAMNEGTLGSVPPDPVLSLSEVARSYKYLAQHVDSIDQISRDAYQQLFPTALPDIELIESQKRTVQPRPRLQ